MVSNEGNVKVPRCARFALCDRGEFSVSGRLALFIVGPSYHMQRDINQIFR